MNPNIEIKPIAQSYLPLAFCENTRQLYFESALFHGQRSRKYAGDLQSVLRSPQKALHDAVCYDFYPGVARFEDCERFSSSNLRYDIIVVHPGAVDGEYKKTSGHVHCPLANGSGTYPEIYEVLHGQALFMLQKADASGTVVVAAAVSAGAGDKLVIPPGFGHATVNIGDRALIFADLVSLDCKNSYGLIAENHGMRFHVVEKDGEPMIIKNPSYSGSAECLHIGCPEQLALGIRSDVGIYKAFIDAPKAFSYLNDPAPYMCQFDQLLLGRT